jgi:DNA polymerase-3 subunit delta
MTQAMLTGNKKAAIIELDKMISNKEEPIAIIGFIASHLYKLLRVMELTEKRMSPKDVAQEAGISDYYVKNLIKQSKNATIKNLRRALEMCHELDVKSKSTSEDIQTAIETFIIEF